MAIYFPPPPVFTGGAQPYGKKSGLTVGVQVDNPPFGFDNVVTLMELVRIAQPDPWVYAFMGGWQPFQPGRLPASITASVSNNPPFTYGGPVTELQEVAYLAQPNPWVYVFISNQGGPGPQPYGPRNLNPSTLAVAVNEPPYTYGGPTTEMQEVAYLTQPNPWVYVYVGSGGQDSQPYAPRQLTPDLISTPANTPPFVYGGPTTEQQEVAYLAQPNPWTYTFAGGGQPFQPRRLPISVSAVREDNPPFNTKRTQLPSILSTWVQLVPPDPVWRYRTYKIALTLGYSRGYIIQ